LKKSTSSGLEPATFRLVATTLPRGPNDNFNNSILVYIYNSIKFFIIYVPSHQLQGQLQTQHSVDTSNYIIVIIIIVMAKSGNSLEVRKQNICI
jgi:hypothetical protein